MAQFIKEGCSGDTLLLCLRQAMSHLVFCCFPLINNKENFVSFSGFWSHLLRHVPHLLHTPETVVAAIPVRTLSQTKKQMKVQGKTALFTKSSSCVFYNRRSLFLKLPPLSFLTVYLQNAASISQQLQTSINTLNPASSRNLLFTNFTYP